MAESTVTLEDAIEVAGELSPARQLRLVAILTERLSRQVGDEVAPLPDVPDVAALERAIGRYRQEEATLAAAAEMAGLTRWELVRVMEARGIPVIVEVPETAEMDRDLAAYMG